ncbi:MAG: serine hydrolase [Planctomycetota bacterium]|nr:serine hydrolase [Planctomycetota bacterium]
MNSEKLSLAVLCLLGISYPFSAFAGPTKRDYWPTKAWKSSKPEGQGMDSAKLKRVSAFLKADQATKGVVIVRGGYIVGEYYFRGFKATDSHRSASVAKSFTSAVIGKAIANGDIKSAQQKVAEIYPPAKDFKGLTIEHLLTMSSGFAWRTKRDKTDILLAESYESYIKTKHLSHRPGRKFIYKPADPMLLSLTLKHVTGKSLRDYGEEHLFKPIGINTMTWRSDSKNVTHGAGGVTMSPRNYARFGYLYLNKGHWDGKQLLPEQWVKRSTTYQTPDKKSYAYLWWHRRPKAPIPADMYSARGSGGQRIIVVPSLDLVVIRVGDDLKRKVAWDRQFMKLIVESVLPEKGSEADSTSEAKKLYSLPRIHFSIY